MNGGLGRGSSRTPHRSCSFLLGAVIGGIVGAVLAVNILIFAGVEGGYEASLSDALDQRPVAAITALVVLVLSPLVGAFVAVERTRSSKS